MDAIYLDSVVQKLKSGIPSVLIVDDDVNIITGLGDVLEDSGYEVKVASDAEEAFGLLQQHAFNMMITDYSLPDGNGVDLALRAKKQLPYLGVILMTGHDPTHISEKIDTNIVKFLRKPVEVAVLLGVLENLIQNQCEELHVAKNERTVPAPLELIVTPPPSPMQTAPLELDFEMERGRVPWAWCGVALLSFGLGWISRGSLFVAGEASPQVSSIVATSSKSPTRTDPPVPNRAAEALVKKTPDHPKAKPQTQKLSAEIKPASEVTTDLIKSPHVDSNPEPSTGLEDLPDPDPTQTAAAPTSVAP